jgi:hypothetical protein
VNQLALLLSTFAFGNTANDEGSQQEAGAAARYFPAFFFFASARRSVFFRRLARFLALSLPLLFPISLKTDPVAPSRHVVVSTNW